jgi:ABC-type Mn2+/Zn2+ transport system ATPase subunit
MSVLVKKAISKGVPHTPDTPTLVMQNVSVMYASGANGLTTIRGKQYALQNVSCRVKAGERVAVVGPNGAGKSTLFKLIAGTVKPSHGVVDVYGNEPGGHICIAYVPQRSQIDWSFPVTVEDVVMMGRVGQIGLFRWPHRQDRQIVQASLARVGASRLTQKQIGELSGGQQQRVFIARALAQEAELLLLDEPLAGLDIPSQEAIFEILDSLRPDGVTVMVATHDLNLAAEQFDRVMLLNQQIVAFDVPAAVLQPHYLLQAYGGHIHVIGEGAGAIMVADSCCDP